MPNVLAIGTIHRPPVSYLPMNAMQNHRHGGNNPKVGLRVATTVGLDSVTHQCKSDMSNFPATVRAAEQAFGMAGPTPAEIDVAELHDFFTGIEFISYEDLGFVDRFGGHESVAAEVTTLGGSLPVNPGGGLKAKGRPRGTSGVAQCVELHLQLRGSAINQMDGAPVASAHNIGGPTAVSAVTILEGPGADGR